MKRRLPIGIQDFIIFNHDKRNIEEWIVSEK